jgi:hypothetical protein
VLLFYAGAFYLTNAGCENQASGLLFDKFGLPVVAASPPRKNRSENVSDWAKTKLNLSQQREVRPGYWP